MTSHDYASVPLPALLDHVAVVRRVVSFLCSEEIGNLSFASLSVALDVPKENLRKEFGTEEIVIDAAADSFPGVALALLIEPLRTAGTGREAVHGMLEIAISLRRGYRQLKDRLAGIRAPAREPILDPLRIFDCGISLEYQIRDRLERSVYEGELPERSDVRAMSALTLTVVSGLVFCARQEDSAATLLDSATLFVNGLGFHVARLPKRRRLQLAPVLQFVRRPAL